MKRLAVVLGLVVGMLLASPTAAHACSCKNLTVTAQTTRADTVLDGTVAWVSSNGIETTYGVRVGQVYKGQSATFEKLKTSASSAACGLTGIAADERYLFFAQGQHPGQMKVDSCDGSRPFAAAVSDQVATVTGPPGIPEFSPLPSSGPINPDPISGTGVGSILGTSAVLAVVIGGLVWLRKRS
ncbi:MAG: hypothetical protein NTV23_00430 [Propionibacteriales bacterium]|nr:hypothetical protein [Propionibacteriales bacterium]